MADIKPRIKDVDWIKQCFILNDNAVEEVDLIRRVMSTAAFKFTDTTLGGNFAINPPPQFTRYADIKTGGGRAGGSARRELDLWGKKDKGTATSVYHGMLDRWEDLKDAHGSSKGMGRYYSEAIDDNSQLVSLRFGVPEYNALFNFLGGFYDPNASALARTGRSRKNFFESPLQATANAVGSAAGMLIAAPFYPLVLGGRVIRSLGNFPATKYYYLKPTMALWRSAVNQICNGIAVNMGLSPYAPADDRVQFYYDEDAIKSPEYRNQFHEMLPDIIGPDGVVDIYAVTTRAQRIANAYQNRLREAMGQSPIRPWDTAQKSVKDYAQALWDGSVTATPTGEAGPGKTMSEYLDDYFDVMNNNTEGGSPDDTAVAQIGDRRQYDTESLTGKAAKTWELFHGERKDGAQFVHFRVDNPGTAGESFSNQTAESGLSQKMNSLSSQNRSTRFDFADGKFTDGFLGKAIGKIAETTTSVVTGALDSMQLSGLVALSGLAFVDIPRVWESSQAQLPRADFTIQLRSPYGNKLSRFTNLMVPLSMLLAGVLPLSTGARSYTSPFICECYSRGRVAIRLGMIDQMTITRGVGNVGWTVDNEPLGIDVNFSVVDLSSVLHMPIVTNFKLWEKGLMLVGGAVAGETGEAVASALTPSTYEDDNSYTDYLAVLGSLSLSQMVHGTRKTALQIARRRHEFATYNTMSHYMSMVSDTTPGRVIRAFSAYTDLGGV